MFGLTFGEGMNMGFPDVCLTPVVVPVPIPYPNISQTATCADPLPGVLMECLPSMNLMSTCELSEGDEAGSLLGVVSHMISGPTMYIVGSTGVLIDGAPAQRLTSVTGQNAMEVLPNTPGVTIVPSQETVLCLV